MIKYVWKREKDILNKKIRLCSLEDNSFNDIKELNNETFTLIKQDINEVNEYRNHFKDYIYFQLSFIEFDQLCKTFKNIPIVNININEFITDNFVMNVNRIVFNLLTAFKYYIDSSERHIVKRFGNESIELVEFTNLTHKYFDKYFSYRFLDKLRNYTIHSNFPINTIPFKAQENIKNPEKMVGNLSLIVNRQELLKEKSYLKSRVTKDLIELTEDIDIEPLLFELSNLISKIEKYVYSTHKSRLEVSISNLNMYARNYKTDKNEISIIYNIREIGNKILAETIKFPFDRIDEIERFRNFRN